MTVCVHFEPVFLLTVDVLGLVEIYIEQGSQKACGQMQLHDSRHKLGAGEGCDNIPPNNIGQGESEQQEEEDFKDQEPEEQNIDSVDHYCMICL